MSPSFLASSSSSASSPLSYLIPRPPPPPLTGQGYASTVNGVAVGGANAGAPAPAPARQGGRPPPRQCPRCGSANTKFCYYNNYSRAQPRYLCKACRRHWTEGGTLRDVPVGGGRKNKRRGGGKGGAKAPTAVASAAAATTTSDPFPDILRQMLFQPAPAAGGGYSIDLSAWQQMAAATAPPPLDAGSVDAVGGVAPDTNCGGVQYWSGWQADDMPGLGQGRTPMTYVVHNEIVNSDKMAGFEGKMPWL